MNIEPSLPEFRAHFPLQDGSGRLVEISSAHESEEQKLIQIFERGRQQKQANGDNAWDARDFSTEVHEWLPRLLAIRLEKQAIGAFILSRRDAVWEQLAAQAKTDQPELLAARALSLSKLVGGMGLGRMAIELAILPYATENGFDSVRVDYPAHNSRLRDYYRRLHFTARGTVEVPLGGTHNSSNESIAMECAQRDLVTPP